MSAIDTALLIALLAIAAWRLVAPTRGRRARRIAWAAAVLLAGLQYALHGFTWQFVGGYVLLAATGLPVRERPGRAWRIAGGLILTALMLASLAPWMVLPVPGLPTPGGPHAVGSTVLRWTDTARAETATPDPADHREVIVQAWYPAAPGASGPGPAYMDGLGRLPPSISGVPRFVFRRFGEARTPAVAGARVAGAAPWPVVIFSPGHGAPRAVYAGLCADLASRGYVVLAMDHPYESAVTQLADGRVVGASVDDGRRDGDRLGYMERQVEVRAADMAFILDQVGRQAPLGPVLAGRLDPARVAAAGHSFGGATAALTAGRDARVLAAADIDGMLYGDPRGDAFRGPLLLLESDPAGTGSYPAYVAATTSLMARVPAGGWRYALAGANHFSFTDADRFLSPPGRWLAARVIGGARGAADTQRSTADILDAFLSGPLKGRPKDVAAAAARHAPISGGPAR